MTNTDDRPLPLLPDQRPPKFPASLGACLTRNGEDTHLRILQSQFGDWTSRKPIYMITIPRKSDKDRNISESPRRKKESRLSSENLQQAILGRYLAENGETPFQTFQRISKVVRIIASVCLALKCYIQKKDSINWSFIEMYLHVKKDMKDILVFNPYNFINDQPLPQGSQKLTRALTILPSFRTPADIILILTSMRNIKCFRDYPPYTQIELCKCMILQHYESRRIVIKQGHPATSFYIIKSGTLLINVTETNMVTGKTFYRSCAELTAGNCFGEVGLLERCTRTASVICKTDCQLLLIPQSDFDRLIREPLLQQKQDHVDFCQSIHLFRHFPCEKLSLNPNEFFYQYFPKETVVTNDANEFKYLIVVMTGKCRLVSCIDLDKADDETDRTSSVRPRTTSRLHGFRKKSDFGLLTRNPPSTEEEKSQPVKKETMLKSESSQTGSLPEKRPRLLKSRTLSQLLHEKIDDEGPNIKMDNGKVNGTSVSRRDGEIIHRPRCNSLLIAKDTVCHKLMMSQQHLVSRRQVYAQIAEFNPGSVFGLETFVHGKRKGLKVLSDGVECLFVSKRLFIQEANIKVLSVVNDMVMTFPTNDEITTLVKQGRIWLNYKQGIIRNSLNHSKYMYRQKTSI